MLMGEGQYAPMATQLMYPHQAYQQINIIAKQSWKCLPPTGMKIEELSKIRQGPDEPYQDFVSHLLQATSSLVVDGEAGMILVQQLAYENVNSACQRAISPYRKKGTLLDYIQLCADIGPSYMQGMAIAAPLQGVHPSPMFRKPMGHGRAQPQKTAGGSGVCFCCGYTDHFAKDCTAGPGGKAVPQPPNGVLPQMQMRKTLD